MTAILTRPWYVHRPSQAIRRAFQLTQRVPGQAAVRVAWGDVLSVNPREAIGAAIWRNAVYDIALSEAIVRLLPRSGVAVDVGANLGYATCLMARLVGTGGRVWSFEPNPALHARLTGNISANGHMPRVTLSFAAASDHSGTASLIIPEWNAQNEGLSHLADVGDAGTEGVEVALVTLDDVIDAPSIDLLKIDVEGHELSVLRGADRLLSQGRVRDILFEEHGGREAETIMVLKAAGYEVFELGWTTWGPRLGPLESDSNAPAMDAQNFLATRDSIRSERVFQRKGFKCLQRC